MISTTVISDELEHVPHAGEFVDLDGYRFKVTKAVARQVQMLNVEKLAEPAPVEPN